MSNRVYRKPHRSVGGVVMFASIAIVMSILTTIITFRCILVEGHDKEEPAQQDTHVVEETAPEQESNPVYEMEALDQWLMTEEELEVVKRVVTAEAAGESFLGQMAVAQCIRETAEVTGMTPYEVVMEPGQYAAPADTATDDVSYAVQLVLYEHLDAVADNIRYFYAPGRVYSKWHEDNLELVCELGSHRFFKTK